MVADPSKNTLIIVESPTKARTISRYLPPTCKVMASKGHVVELAPSPTKGVYGVDVDHGYELEYEIEDDKKKLLSDIKKAMKGVDQLVLATDEDREGESISWHLYNELKPKCPVYRMVFHEITRQAITNAFSSCREIDMNLVHAQEARRAVDRLQGYGISPILSRKLGGKYSAGRVQSPGLKLIVEKEKVRRDYRKSGYSSVEVEMERDGITFQSTLISIDGNSVASSRSYDKETGVLKAGVIALDEESAKSIADEINGMDAVVESVMNKDSRQNPAMPFTTSTLQQDASRKLRKGVREIMSIAQSLYENGFITYMRTDSPTLSSECISASRRQVEEMFGSEYLSYKPRNYKASSESAQEAHEAIRPAGDKFRRPEETGLTGDSLKLYTLIWKRTLATQMREAEKSTTSAVFAIGRYSFASSGTTIKFPGFLKLYEAASDEKSLEKEEGILPNLDAGSYVHINSAEQKGHSTEPPARYNEASLVQKLESEGIGRPSTYATIISTLIDRQYVIRQKDQLVPTFTGFFVDSFLESSFPLYIGYGFTSDMESKLDHIADGTVSKENFLDEFWKGDSSFEGLEKDIASVRQGVRRSDVKSLKLSGLEYRIQHDGKDIAYSIKTGKFGPYLSAETSESDDGKEKMASIDQMRYFPGTFTDEDASEILFPEKADPVYVAEGIQVLNGRYGEYFRRDSDGKIANIQRNKKASSYTPELVQLLFTLPKTIGSDADGNEVTLNAGPYGIYAKYNGRNIRVADPFNVDLDSILSDKPSEPKPIKEFPDFEGKPLAVIDGRYGAYLKWGDKNCPLSKEEKKDPASLSEERAHEIALTAPERKSPRRRYTKKS